MNRLENVEETAGASKESGKSKTHTVGRGDDRAGAGPETTKDGSTEDEGKKPGGRLAPDPAEAPLATASDDGLLKAASSAAEAPREAPDVSDMMLFSLDYPGGACVASLSLMSLGMVNVHISIPKHIVVVDSNLVDTDAVKR